MAKNLWLPLTAGEPTSLSKIAKGPTGITFLADANLPIGMLYFALGNNPALLQRSFTGVQKSFRVERGVLL